jgi:iron(III) transport system ATP-binding protein
MLLKIHDVSRANGSDFALSNINFSLERNGRVALAGETGSGKSTLLKIIGGLLDADSGKVIFRNRNVVGPSQKLVPGHPEIAYLSQHFDLPKFLRVEQVLAYANSLSRKQADEIYSICRIGHLLKRKTDELSGGERQRIAIARLLITKPKLLLLDEPYSNLDSVLKNILKQVIQEIGLKLNLSIILVSHDPADTLSWADQIMVLKDGNILQVGTPKDIYENPINQYVAGLFGSYMQLSPVALKVLGITSKTTRIIRPENIEVFKTKAKVNTGKILSIVYFGTHYEIEIKAGKWKLLANAKENQFVIGDKVKVRILK